MDPSLTRWLDDLRRARSEIAPLFLLADSRPLFARLGEGSFAERVAAELRDAAWLWGPRAAYLGACSGDEPAYYEIFEAFADAAGCPAKMHVPAPASGPERDFLAEADLVVLGGGDPEAGWARLVEADLVEPLRRAFEREAVFVGVSAGATLLGLGPAPDHAGLAFVPLVIDSRGEPSWERLAGRLDDGVCRRGVGIPAGGAAIFHPDETLEPVVAPLVELSRAPSGEVREVQLLPPAAPSRPAASDPEAS